MFSKGRSQVRKMRVKATKDEGGAKKGMRGDGKNGKSGAGENRFAFPFTGHVIFS